MRVPVGSLARDAGGNIGIVTKNATIMHSGRRLEDGSAWRSPKPSLLLPETVVLPLLAFYGFTIADAGEAVVRELLAPYARAAASLEGERMNVQEILDELFGQNRPNLPKVYLAGPINGVSDTECKVWRAKVAKLLEGDALCIDPTIWDLRGKELEAGVPAEIVNRDLALIDSSSVFFAYCPVPSVGTSMELFYASRKKKPTFVVTGHASSPWIVHHASVIFDTFEEAAAGVRGFLGAGSTFLLS